MNSMRFSKINLLFGLLFASQSNAISRRQFKLVEIDEYDQNGQHIVDTNTDLYTDNEWDGNCNPLNFNYEEGKFRQFWWYNGLKGGKQSPECFLDLCKINIQSCCKITSMIIGI